MSNSNAVVASLPTDDDGSCSDTAINANNNLQPIALLVDELRSDQLQARLNAYKKLPVISLALGAERTRVELVPFLQNSISSEEDEIVAELASQIKDTFVLECLGGSNYAFLLLPILEILLSADESIIRQNAINSLEKIINLTKQEEFILEFIVPMIKRLAEGDWFSRKCSSASLIGFSVSLISKDEERNELFQMLSRLCRDDSASVRRASVQSLSQVIKSTNKFEATNALLPILQDVSDDIQDTVRLLSIESWIVISEKLSIKTKWLDIYTNFSNDKSWRIRCVLASEYDRIIECLRPSFPEIEVAKTFCALLKDDEPEVRIAAANKLSAVAALLSPSEIEFLLLPTIRLLINDMSCHVKAALAGQLNQFTTVIDRELAIQSVLPLMMQFLKDDSSDIRLNIISQLSVTVGVIGVNQLFQSLLPAINKLSEDRQWRVRQTIIEYIPQLATLLGYERFESSIAPMVLNWLNDQVSAVRKSAAESIGAIVNIYGPVKSSGLINKLYDFVNHSNYLRRISLLDAIVEISKSLSSHPDILFEYIWERIIVPLSRDKINNVRLSACQTLVAIIPIWIPNHMKILKEHFLPLLQQLASEDTDQDARYFANEAMNLIFNENEHLNEEKITIKTSEMLF